VPAIPPTKVLEILISADTIKAAMGKLHEIAAARRLGRRL